MARTLISTREYSSSRTIVQRGFQGISGIDYKGILGDTNESKNYVDIPTLTFNPSNSSWSLFLEYFPPDNIHTSPWYNISLYSQNNGTGTGRSWLIIPLEPQSKGQISSFFGGVTLISGMVVRPSQRNSVVLYYDYPALTLGFIINGVQANIHTGTIIESATGAHRVGSAKDDPTLVPPHGVRCFPGIIGRVQLYRSRILTVSESLALHNENVDQVSRTGIILDFKMQQNSGTVIDDSGNGNHGTIKVYDPPTGNEAEWVSNYVVPSRGMA